jgi:hypothetical protein
MMNLTRRVSKQSLTPWLTRQAFMVSSLNHHISLMKLRVHKAYLDLLETGRYPDGAVPDEWCKPEVKRTEWFDLLKPAERAEAFCLLWALGGYLAR